MNREKFLQQLSDALDAITIHPDLLPELISILAKSGTEGQFLSILTKRLDFLSEHGTKAVQYSKDFERLNNEICSLHVDLRDKNIRILYTIRKDGTILLLAFHERAGKQATDYSKPTPKAEQRLHELEE